MYELDKRKFGAFLAERFLALGMVGVCPGGRYETFWMLELTLGGLFLPMYRVGRKGRAYQNA